MLCDKNSKIIPLSSIGNAYSMNSMQYSLSSMLYGSLPGRSPGFVNKV